MEIGGYKKAESFIKDFIKEKSLKPGDRLPPFRKIAKEAHISIATVQRVIAAMVSGGSLVSKVGSGTYISEHRSGASVLIGVIAPFSMPESGNFLAEIFIGIQEGLKPYNAHYLYYAHPNDIRGFTEEKEEAELKKIESLNIKGFIVNHYGDDENIWRFIEKTRCPVVCINNSHPFHKYSCVTLDNYQGGILAAEYFIKMGHRNCAVLLTYPNNTSSVQERIDGFSSTLKKSGMEFTDKNIITITASEKDPPVRRIKEYITSPPNITAFFAINDPLAVIAMTQLKKDGLRIPDDVSIMGFDGSTLCCQVEPKLTSVLQSGAEMGVKAASLLCSMIKNEFPASGEIIEIRLKPELIINSSVKKI